MNSSVFFQIQNFLVLMVLYVGVFYRKRPSKHVPIMLAGIGWDLLLVLQIELTRHAINKASHALTNPIILNIHVSLAVSTVLLYFVVLYLGFNLRKGKEHLRKKHKFFGLVTLMLRSSTFITSFLVVHPASNL